MTLINSFGGLSVGDIVTINNNCHDCLASWSYPARFKINHLNRKGKIIKIADNSKFKIGVEYFENSFFPSEFWWHRPECITVAGINHKFLINKVFGGNINGRREN